MKQQFVTTHVIPQTETPTLLDRKNAICQNVVSTKKLLPLYFHKNIIRLNVGPLMICQVFFSVSCKTVYLWVTRNLFHEQQVKCNNL